MINFDLSKDPLLYANMANALRRGSARILEDSEEGLFLYDPSCHLYLMTAPTALGMEWLQKHENRGYTLMVLYDDALIGFAAERYGLTVDEKCKQLVWTSELPPEGEQTLLLRIAEAADSRLCMDIYRNSSEEDILASIEQGNIFLGYDGETLVGMVGIHMDGSMGMLEVLPPFRRRGFGTQLEKAMIRRQLAAGQIPYGQVYLSNAASFALQESIGMECSRGTLTWLFRE